MIDDIKNKCDQRAMSMKNKQNWSQDRISQHSCLGSKMWLAMVIQSVQPANMNEIIKDVCLKIHIMNVVCHKECHDQLITNVISWKVK